MTDDTWYFLLAGLVSVYLLLGIRFSLKGFLKGILLAQILGELIYHSRWEDTNTYSFLRSVSLEASIAGTLFLLLALMITDLAGLIFRFFPPNQRLSHILKRYSFSNDYQLFAILTLAIGFAAKLIELYSAGALNVFSIASYQPEDTLGRAFLVEISDFAIPVGLAMWGAGRKNLSFPFVELGLLVVIGYFSYSKAAILGYLLIYFSAHLLTHGFKPTRIRFLKWWTFPIWGGLLIVMIASFGIKAQQRFNQDFNPDTIVEAAGQSVGLRFGSIYRIYLSVADLIINQDIETMQGYYHEQVLYLWIPRALWPDKPRVASEQLNGYLNITEENYGTAFASNTFGTLLVDFGPIGALFGCFVFGAILFLGDRSFRRIHLTRQLPVVQVYLMVAWISMSEQLAEGGIPPAATRFFLLVGLLCVLIALNYVLLPLWKTSQPSKQLETSS